VSESVKDLRGELQARRDTLAGIFAEAGDDLDFSNVKSLEGDTAAKVEKVKALNDEMTDLAKRIEESDELAGIKAAVDASHEVDNKVPLPGTKNGGRREKTFEKSLGELFVESESFKAFRPGSQGSSAAAELAILPPEFRNGLDLKTTFTAALATLTGYDRSPAMVLVGTQRLTVADLLAKGQTSAPVIRYPQEDTFTNAATTVDEGALKPEAAFDTSEVDAPVRKIAVTAKVTDELFGDFPAMRDYIDNRLRYMVGLTEEAQLLNGNGTAPNIKGILQTAGIQTQALAGDPVPDGVYKAIVKVQATGFFEPDGAVFHPLDWQDIRLLKTVDGIYIWGPPMDPGPDRIWGLNVVRTTSMTQNTGLVGAFQLGAQVFYREGMRVEATNSNEDDFKKNLIAIRAEQREALAVYRPKAFCTITGI